MLTNVGILWTFWLHRAYFSKKKKQTSMENENGWRENVFLYNVYTESISNHSCTIAHCSAWLSID